MPELWLFCLPFPIKILTSRDFSFKYVSEVVFVELGSRSWFSGLGAGVARCRTSCSLFALFLNNHEISKSISVILVKLLSLKCHTLLHIGIHKNPVA